TYARLDPLIVGVGLAALRIFQPCSWTTLTKCSRWLWAPGILASRLCEINVLSQPGFASSLNQAQDVRALGPCCVTPNQNNEAVMRLASR
ncbi:MAG: hypothetical protein M3Y86_03270, partial [Verrucomicrobiota bacterium]|nr:hypothetical protein [Verrucomicrobiota bacterium]